MTNSLATRILFLCKCAIILGLLGVPMPGVCESGDESAWKSFDARVIVPRPREWLPLKSEGMRFQMPYASNAAITTKTSVHDTLYVPIHGGGRNARKMVKLVENVLQASSRPPKRPLIFAPYFLYEWNVTRAERKRGAIFWAEGWNGGHVSKTHPRITSFHALNAALQAILAAHPEIHNVVFIGHSAGGQFLQRYMHFQHGLESVATSYVIANPSSYLYLNDARRAPSSLLAGCPDFDRYKWGLKGMPTALRNLQMPDPIVHYREQSVAYVLARGDVSRDEFLATSCADEAQGKNRFQRGQNYKRWLRDTFGNVIFKTSRFVYLPRSIGHDNDAVLSHSKVKELILSR